MALDERLRDSLRRSSLIVDPDVRRDLSEVRRKSRHAVVRQRVGNTLLAAAVVAATVFLGPGIVDVIRNQRRSAAVPAPPAQLIGSYRGDLTNGSTALRTAGLAGPWTITFNSDGAIIWNPPSSASIVEGFPRDTYQVAPGSIVTNLFARNLCQGTGAGTYAWRVSGDTLSFTLVSDPCNLRRAVLTSTSWIKA